MRTRYPTPNTFRRSAVGFILGLGGLCSAVNLANAQPWEVRTAPPPPYGYSGYRSWSALAASADGESLVAVSRYVSPTGFVEIGPGSTGSNTNAIVPLPPPTAPSPSSLMLSTNGGVTFALSSAPTNQWQAVASSADGARLVAAASMFLSWPSGWSWTSGWGPVALSGDGLIYLSSDSGATWRASTAPNNAWRSIASSADGSRLLAAATRGRFTGPGPFVSGDGLIYTSTNSGTNWQLTSAPSQDWASVACSANGAWFIAAGDAHIYLSSDAGATWITAGAPTNRWTSVAVSADGTRLVAAAALNGSGPSGSGRIYISTDSGASWTQTSAPTNDWASVVSSADGSRLFALGNSAGYPGVVYASSDSGLSWTATGSPSELWSALATSADGYKAVAGSLGGWLCTLPYLGAWRLASAPISLGGPMAASKDLNKLVAADSIYPGGLIYTSSDSGRTWRTASAPSNDWSSVASSTDGTKLVASAGPWTGQDSLPGLIYTSGDSGATWAPSYAPPDYWQAVASSADGTKLFAVSWGYWPPNFDVIAGSIYRTMDSGVHWSVTTAPHEGWVAITTSADGQKLAASRSSTDRIYTSNNSGVTWLPSNSPSNSWVSIASSADGSTLIAAGAYGSRVYLSPDSGLSWIQTDLPTNAGNPQWTSVASSADGATLVAMGMMWAVSVSEGWHVVIWVSTDSGRTWALSDPPAANWQGMAVASGASGVVAVGPAAVCTLGDTALGLPLPPAPRLSIGLSGATVELSWLVPSTCFVLQKSSALNATSWADVSAAPTLNLSNLHLEQTVPPSLGRAFYRLKQQ
jgi:hypothetical protein